MNTALGFCDSIDKDGNDMSFFLLVHDNYDTVIIEREDGEMMEMPVEAFLEFAEIMKLDFIGEV